REGGRLRPGPRRAARAVGHQRPRLPGLGRLQRPQGRRLRPGLHRPRAGQGGGPPPPAARRAVQDVRLRVALRPPLLPGAAAPPSRVPLASPPRPAFDPRGQSLRAEVGAKLTAQQGRFDPDEAAWVARRVGLATKALGTVGDTAGGTLVQLPVLGELIELQRNLEVFANAGAQEIALPPNGRIQFPKLTGGSTAYWVGEATSITESTPATGNLDLQAKKLGVFVKINNELLRFATPS